LVRDLANVMLTNAPMLRVFMRQAAVNAVAWERAPKARMRPPLFQAAFAQHRDVLGHSDPDLAVDIAYCAISRRITHGPRFESGREVSDAGLVDELARAVSDYLL
jgi:hypothetical protein